MDDGARTHDKQNHNLLLYQLNYTHRIVGNVINSDGISVNGETHYFQRVNAPRIWPNALNPLKWAYEKDKYPKDIFNFLFNSHECLYSEGSKYWALSL